jgi:hypothetical protein
MSWQYRPATFGFWLRARRGVADLPEADLQGGRRRVDALGERRLEGHFAHDREARTAFRRATDIQQGEGEKGAKEEGAKGHAVPARESQAKSPAAEIRRLLRNGSDVCVARARRFAGARPPGTAEGGEETASTEAGA